MECPLIFLTYIQRSGSTLLARMLSGYEGVGSTLANEFPDGLLLPEIRIRSADDIEPAVSALYASTKFAAWHVDRGRLTRALERAALPIGFPALLGIIHGLFFHGRQVQLIIHKRGAYILHLDSVRRLFPRSRVLFLQRDPRAVFTSLKTSIHSVTGAPMLSDPVALARYFNRIIRIVARYGGDHADSGNGETSTGHLRTSNPGEEPNGSRWFLRIRYEDLVANPTRLLETVFRFAGFTDPPRRTSSSYAESIPDEQKHLHARVSMPPSADRIDAWRDDIETADLYILQTIAGRAMKEAGYRPEAVRSRPLALLLALARHLLGGRQVRRV